MKKDTLFTILIVAVFVGIIVWGLITSNYRDADIERIADAVEQIAATVDRIGGGK